MTVFGDSIAPHGGAVWLGSLIALLSPFGISDRLVRTSVFRLAEEGWLESRREGRRSLYALTAVGLHRFEHAYRRIYARPSQQWSGTWTLVIAATDTISATERGTLRKELLWEGFSMIAPGVFARPTGNAEVLEEIFSRTGLSGKLSVCEASELNQLRTRPLSDFIEQGWELESVMKNYQHFIKQFGTLVRLFGAQAIIDPEQAFVIRTLLMHAFRRIQLHDPLLPLELLPDGWPGTAAYELCRQIYQLTYASAEQHLTTTLRREDENAPTAAPYFRQRFGGLT
jgi:phenylacetic acid degradation operon negative regulatory protein